MRMITAGCALTTLVLVAGCGDAGPPFETATVSGRITLSDGRRLDPEETIVRFIPQKIAPIDGQHPRTGEAHLTDDGRLAKVTTYKPGDGLIVGRHKVVLESYLSDGTQMFDARYADSRRTPWEVEVKKGQPNEFHLEIKK